jgi:hypothetical protein
VTSSSDIPEPAGAMFPAYKRALVAELVPYARNARTHSDSQVAPIAASIREFSFTNPILVDGTQALHPRIGDGLDRGHDEGGAEPVPHGDGG